MNIIQYEKKERSTVDGWTFVPEVWDGYKLYEAQSLTMYANSIMDAESTARSADYPVVEEEYDDVATFCEAIGGTGVFVVTYIFTKNEQPVAMVPTIVNVLILED